MNPSCCGKKLGANACFNNCTFADRCYEVEIKGESKMKMFVTRNYSSLIDVVEVERKTDKSVWIKGRRLSITSSWNNYFNTFDDAKNYLLLKSQKQVLAAQKKLEYSKEMYEEIKSLNE